MVKNPVLCVSTTELLNSLESGNLTSRRLVESCLEQIRLQNPELNAFVSVDEQHALDRADQIDRRRATGAQLGLLGGLPLGIKDNMCRQGKPTTCGSRMLKNYQPPYNAHVVERIEAEDGIIVGTTNMDEFAMGSSTETSIYGPSRNPSNPDHSAGGSSGGSAVAVASGMVPLSLGSDTGGSIRQPAAFCGCIGLKPTYGRVSRFGLVAFASSLDQIGPFARDAAGASLLLQVIAGHDTRDSTSLKRETPAYSEQFEKAIHGMRIGIVDEHFGQGLNSDVATSVTSTIEALKEMGATVRKVTLPHARYSIATYYLIAPSEASSNLARYDGIHYGHRPDQFDDLTDLYCRSRGEGFGPEVKRRIMLGTYALSAGYYDAYYLRALRVRRCIREDFDRAFEEVDVIAGPVSPTPAFPIGDKADNPLAMYLNDIYTISANLAGIPGISVPTGVSDSGLPLAIQFQAPLFNELRLLQLAAAVESVSETDNPGPAPLKN
ncbi:MAG: Asp-tRNA(Asn)/Glu-tRNA(Gln) amidotransferase subunit GatA [Fuerstiella sp.]|nr:Asp-tRNA(Asn)/Glu-tRNA(Gln) amidotransferase subunit GatA [Fuerstiella sp.]